MTQQFRMSFADEIVNAGFEIDPETRIINAQSIYDQLNTDGGFQGILPENILENTPSIPMFKYAFVEYERDLKNEMLRSNDLPVLFELQKVFNLYKIKIGFFMSDANADSEVAELTDGFMKRHGVADNYRDNYRCWLCTAFMTGIGGELIPMNHGIFLSFNRETGIFAAEKSGRVLLRTDGYDGSDEYFAVYGVALLAFALMHMKTPVVLVDLPRNYRRRIERKTGKEPSNYFMIDVDALKPKKRYIQAQPRRAGKNYREQHFVRGHFRYNHEHAIPQFAHRAFWIESHTRGTGDNEVKRNYRIVLPKKESK